MTVEEAETWRADRDLALWKEALDVEPLFKFVVNARGDVILCNQYEADQRGDRTRLVLEDCWVYDALMTRRMVPRVEMVVQEYSIAELAGA